MTDGSDEERFGLGREEDLPDHAVVIRVAIMTDANLARNAEFIERDTPGLHALSIQTHPSMSEDEIAWGMEVIGKWLNVTTAGEIRHEFKVVPDPSEGPLHGLILLGGPPEPPDTWDRVRSCFPVKEKSNHAYGKSPAYEKKKDDS